VPNGGNGYATEIAQGAVRHRFEDLGPNQICGVVVPENIASRRVLKEAGLTRIRHDRCYRLACDVLRISRPAAD